MTSMPTSMTSMSTPPSLLNLPNEILYAIIGVLDESSHCKLVLTTPHFSRPLIAHYLHSGGSLLHIATRQGRATLVGLLLNNGADIHARANGSTALHIAAEHNHARVAELLLKNGAEINARTNNYREETALLIAIVRKKTKMVSLLLDFQADITSYEKLGGGTPLHLAAGHGDLEIIKLLIEHGADPNALDHKGVTPLHWASDPPSPKVAMVLIELGANYTNDYFLWRIWGGIIPAIP